MLLYAVQKKYIGTLHTQSSLHHIYIIIYSYISSMKPVDKKELEFRSTKCIYVIKSHH